MRFRYQARSRAGEIQAGAVEASSRETALALLQRHQLFITLLEEERPDGPLLAKKIKLFGAVSKKDVVTFQLQLADNLTLLYRELQSRTYKHSGYSAFNLSDPKPRNIHKALVRDRVIHHLIYKELYQYFNERFIFDSYSCRKDKGTHRALDRFKLFAGKVSKNHTKICYALKCDIRKFFASIDHEILLNILNEYIPDKDIILLLQNIIESFHTVDINCHSHRNGNPDNCRLDSRCDGNDKRVGLPLGNLTSQLFANVYMNKFDQWVKHKLKSHYYVRYADDFVFLSRDKFRLEEAIPKIQEFLQTNLKLSLHPNKLFLKTIASGMDFLGWVHFSNHNILRHVTKNRMMRRIKEHTTPETLHSYLGLLSHGNTEKIIDDVIGEYWLWKE